MFTVAEPAGCHRRRVGSASAGAASEPGARDGRVCGGSGHGLGCPCGDHKTPSAGLRGTVLLPHPSRSSALTRQRSRSQRTTLSAGETRLLDRQTPREGASPGVAAAAGTRSRTRTKCRAHFAPLALVWGGSSRRPRSGGNLTFPGSAFAVGRGSGRAPARPPFRGPSVRGA